MPEHDDGALGAGEGKENLTPCPRCLTFHMSTMFYMGARMSSEEKSAWIMLVVPVVAYATYLAIILGRADGTWRNGWKDFDPRAPLMTP